MHTYAGSAKMQWNKTETLLLATMERRVKPEKVRVGSACDVVQRAEFGNFKTSEYKRVQDIEQKGYN